MNKLKARLKRLLKGTKIKNGFSLIELIVTVAIMAVLAVVLIPSVSHYVEGTRAKKDSSSADEITKAISVGLANKDVYDELLEHVVKGNVSCYIDQSSEAGYEKIESTTRYTFNDDSRLLDETPFFPAGNMRGVTITFEPKQSPSGSETEYEVRDGIINKYIPEKTEQLKDDINLYNKIRSVVGEEIVLKSQTYRNSELTVFIALGSGGHEKKQNAKDAIEVYCQFSGTNLPAEEIEYTPTTDRVSDYVPDMPEETPEGSGGESGEGGNGGSHIHNYTSQVVPPTCKEQGYTSYSCSCGDNYKENFKDKVDHQYNEGVTTTYPTCTTEGSKDQECMTCGHKKTVSVSELGHSYNAVVTPATCKDKGYTTHTCSRCQDSYIDSYVDATVHIWSTGEITKEATCISNGNIAYTCSLCGEERNESIPMLGHAYKDVVKAPTCTEEGYTTHTCSNCGDVYVDTKVPLKNHTYSEWTTVNAATCELAGNKTRNCTICGKSETAVIDSLGHDYQDDYTIDIEATCTTDGSKSQHCNRCNSTRNNITIDAFGHDWDEGHETVKPTCEGSGTKAYKCNTCGETKTEDLDATGHDYKDTIVPPTTTTEGHTLHTCLNCGLSYKDNFVPKIGVSISGTVKIIEELTANVKVELKQNGETKHTVYTNEDGEFIIDAIPCGEYETLVTYRSEHQWSQMINIESDGDVFRFSFLLAPGVYDHDNNLLITWEQLTSMDYHTIPEHQIYVGWDEELEESIYETSPAQPILNISNDGILSTVYCDDCIWNLSIDGIVEKTKLGGYYDSELEEWIDVPLGKLIISEDIKGLDDYSLSYFDQCFSIVALPDTIETVGNNAISRSYNEGITINKIPNSLKSVGDYGFSCCNVLNPITELPESLLSIGLYAFESFELNNIYISENVTHISGPICNNVETIVVDTNNPKYDSRNGCNAVMETATNTLIVGCENSVIPNETLGIGDYAFYNTGYTIINIPNKVQRIGEYAFQDTKASNLLLPNSITEIGQYSFASCGLQNITFSNQLDEIPFRAFYDNNLKEVTIPGNIKTIFTDAFFNCRQLESAILEEGVEVIQYDAFDWCHKLSMIQLPSTTTDISYGAFQEPDNYYISGAVDDYWFNKETGEKIYYKNLPEGVAATYVAIKPLIVTFDANGGSCSTAQKVVENGEKYGTLPTPTRNSYVFALWMKESSDFEDIYLHDNKETSGATGELRDNTTYASSDLIPVNGGFTFYSNMIVCGVYTYDANKTLIERVSDYCNEHVIPSNAKYIRIEVAKINGLTYSDYENYLALGYEVTSSTINNDTADHTLYAIWAYNTSFQYNAGYYTYYALVSGTYRLNAYGAQGGASICNGAVGTPGGPGGFATGTIYLNAGDFVYVVVGGVGANGVVGGTAAGGFNGGGSGTWDGNDDEASGGGGGATHFILNQYRGGVMLAQYASYKNDILLVAGGGGGSSWSYQGGAGGGANGGTTSGTSSSYPTQSGGYAFGLGQNGSGVADSDGVAGGGGGWYGGYANNVAAKSAGTGGSGYVGGVSNGTMEYGVRTGNGYAEITFVSR